MKRLALLLIIPLLGCGAHRAKVIHPVITIPGNCILGGIVKQANCKALDGERAVCNGVVVKFACVKVERATP